MKKKFTPFGFDLLRTQILTSVSDWMAEVIQDHAKGDSEIERLLCAAIILSVHHGCNEYEAILIPDGEVSADILKDTVRSRTCLILESQVAIGKYRVDFVAHAWTPGTVWGGDGGPVAGAPRWRRLVIECDGHDFHERTKEQAARDRSRDRALTSDGYDVYRFTGSEIWRDPLGCADQVIEWAQRGLG